jgi:hypothetical protein
MNLLKKIFTPIAICALAAALITAVWGGTPQLSIDLQSLTPTGTAPAAGTTGNSCAGAVREEARDAGVCHQGDVGQMHNLPDAVDIGIGLGVNKAGITVARIAAERTSTPEDRFVALQSQRHGKGVDATSTYTREFARTPEELTLADGREQCGA